MAVNPLAQLTVEAHPLGHELRIEWIKPSSLPTNYKVYLFKMQGQYPSQAQIDAYMTNSTIASGMTVWNNISNDAYGYQDYAVVNGLAYYYKALIKNNTSGEYSATVQDYETPVFSATVNVVDWKEVVCACLVKLFKNYNLVVDKDIDIRKAFSLDPNLTTPFVTVIRQGANDVMRLWGNLLKDEEDAKAYGKVEQDNILIVWEDINSDRRDKLTQIFRANEQTLRRYIIKYQALDVRIDIGSDDIDLRWESRELHTGQMMIQIIFESSIEYKEPEFGLPYHDVEHVFTT